MRRKKPESSFKELPYTPVSYEATRNIQIGMGSPKPQGSWHVSLGVFKGGSRPLGESLYWPLSKWHGKTGRYLAVRGKAGNQTPVRISSLIITTPEFIHGGGETVG